MARYQQFDGGPGQQQAFSINTESSQARNLIYWFPMNFDQTPDLIDLIQGNRAVPNSGASVVADSTFGNVAELSDTTEFYRFDERLVPRGGSRITISVWMYITEAFSVVDHKAILKFSNSNQGWTTRFGENGDQSNAFLEWYIGDGSAYHYTSFTHSVSLNTWTLLTLTYDGTTMRIYIDGLLVHSGVDSFTPNFGTTGTNRDLGDDNSTSSKPGKYKDIRVYDRTLSAQEVWGLWDPRTRFDLYLVDRFLPVTGFAAADISHVAALAESFDNVVQRRPIKVTSY